MNESRLMAAVGALLPYLHEPNSKEYRAAVVAIANVHAQLTAELAMNINSTERLAPIKMRITMENLSEDELISLEDFIQTKLKPRRDRERKELELQIAASKMDVWKAHMDRYNQHLEAMNARTGMITLVSPKPWWKKII